MACNTNNRNCNGTLEQNLDGGCPERVCIQTKRVFDACIRQQSLLDQNLTVTFPTMGNFSFVSGKSTGASYISNLSITALTNSCCSRVKYTVTVPMQIVAVDNCNNKICGTSSLVFNQDMLLKLPEESLTPTEIQCTATCIIVSGTLNGNTLICNICATLITKVVAEIELIVRALGYPNLPNCQEFAEDLCGGVFALPVYPKETTCNR